MYIVENNNLIDSVNITFNSVKGKGEDVNEMKIIERHTENPDFCFVVQFTKYLKSKHGINIEELNKIRNLHEWKNKKIWNIKRYSFRD